MQTVGHLLEDLSRFSPNARMEPEINLQSFAPNCFCKIDGFNPDLVEELREEIKELEGYENKACELLEALNLIKEYLDEGNHAKAKEIATDNYDK